MSLSFTCARVKWVLPPIGPLFIIAITCRVLALSSLSPYSHSLTHSLSLSDFGSSSSYRLMLNRLRLHPRILLFFCVSGPVCLFLFLSASLALITIAHSAVLSHQLCLLDYNRIHESSHGIRAFIDVCICLSDTMNGRDAFHTKKGSRSWHMISCLIRHFYTNGPQSSPAYVKRKDKRHRDRHRTEFRAMIRVVYGAHAYQGEGEEGDNHDDHHAFNKQITLYELCVSQKKKKEAWIQSPWTG